MTNPLPLPAPLPLALPAPRPDTMRVTVRDHAEWGTSSPYISTPTVTISSRCPVCGGPRGEPKLNRYVEDGEWYNVDNWTNPCGHVDGYKAVLKEARALELQTAYAPGTRMDLGEYGIHEVLGAHFEGDDPTAKGSGIRLRDEATGEEGVLPLWIMRKFDVLPAPEAPHA